MGPPVHKLACCRVDYSATAPMTHIIPIKCPLLLCRGRDRKRCLLFAIKAVDTASSLKSEQSPTRMIVPQIPFGNLRGRRDTGVCCVGILLVPHLFLFFCSLGQDSSAQLSSFSWNLTKSRFQTGSRFRGFAEAFAPTCAPSSYIDPEHRVVPMR